jgi:amidophosphoribosyltransferase
MTDNVDLKTQNELTTHPFDDDKLKEECGVFGVIGSASAAAMTALGLHALQHRGQEAAGIVSFDGEQFHAHHALGHVGENFNSEAVIKKLLGSSAVGHTRYSTSGEAALHNVQPLFADFDFGGFGIAHNGNLTNAYTLRKQLVKRGCLFRSTSDTEVVIHLMAMARGGNVIDRMIEALRQIEGAYSLVALAKDILIGVRDPHGVRPLVLGQLDNAYVLASETCALDIIGANFVRDIEPGEMVVINTQGVQSLRPFIKANPKFCIFEYVYFARPDSMMEGRSVYEMRKNIGIELARESQVEADSVVAVPDSGVPAAIGYAQESGIPFDLGIIRNHYVGRTFIQPASAISASSSSIMPTAASSKANASFLSMIQSCVARLRPKSSKWCAPQAPRKCICASPARRRGIVVFTASIRHSRKNCSRIIIRSIKCAALSARTASLSCRWTASTAPSAKPSATPTCRNSAMPVSAANIRLNSPICIPPTTTTNCRCLRAQANSHHIDNK